MPGVPGAMNFRDIGGLPAGDRVTRSGVLFRSGNLARLGDEGRAGLRELGIRRIVDLRDDDEVVREPSLIEGLDIEVRRAPLFLGSVASFFTEDISLEAMYRALVDDSSARITEVVRAVLGDQPVLVHCTVGKDRTGVTVAIMLAAAGVDRSAVVADYARTETLLPAAHTARVVAGLRHLHPEARHLEELATRSPAPVMTGLLDDLATRFGSPADYLRAHGIADDELTELRRVIVGP
ncbi:MAG: protein tyrosine phosphatase [Microbacterium sp. SCN 70-200]|nr:MULTISPECIES: tyrosine-protein phosphatase [unclassified Microbacterium]MBN9213934.1 tyrosine-protein phosphatase [Microbacterium sp.]ODT42472.1 MAG: protein tyrosine phosphatase [Microbacterium sp. SCN 70-200]OJV85399.1 MAG: protein tyrosine phosphatase [Microbacterium sp. 70-16]